jgi:hypothetical protein
MRGIYPRRCQARPTPTTRALYQEVAISTLSHRVAPESRRLNPRRDRPPARELPGPARLGTPAVFVAPYTTRVPARRPRLNIELGARVPAPAVIRSCTPTSYFESRGLPRGRAARSSMPCVTTSSTPRRDGWPRSRPSGTPGCTRSSASPRTDTRERTTEMPLQNKTAPDPRRWSGRRSSRREHPSTCRSRSRSSLWELSSCSSPRRFPGSRNRCERQ